MISVCEAYTSFFPVHAVAAEVYGKAGRASVILRGIVSKFLSDESDAFCAELKDCLRSLASS